MLSCCCCSRNTTSTTTLRAYFCENKGRICLLREPNTATHHTKNLHSKHTNRRRSNVRRCELRRVLENRRDVVLEVRQRVRRNRPRRAQGAALVQGSIITLASFSFRSRIDRSIFLFPVAFFADTSLSLFQKARARDAVYFKAQKYVKGSPEAAVITEVIPAEIPK